MKVSRNKIIEIVFKIISADQIERSFIYWYKKLFNKGDEIRIGLQTIKMPFRGTIVFVDLAPQANWTHPCLYIFVDMENFNTEVYEAAFPLNLDPKDKDYTIILRFGKKPPNRYYFNAFDK